MFDSGGVKLTRAWLQEAALPQQRPQSVVANQLCRAIERNHVNTQAEIGDRSTVITLNWTDRRLQHVI